MMFQLHSPHSIHLASKRLISNSNNGFLTSTTYCLRRALYLSFGCTHHVSLNNSDKSSARSISSSRCKYFKQIVHSENLSKYVANHFKHRCLSTNPLTETKTLLVDEKTNTKTSKSDQNFEIFIPKYECILNLNTYEVVREMKDDGISSLNKNIPSAELRNLIESCSTIDQLLQKLRRNRIEYASEPSTQTKQYSSKFSFENQLWHDDSSDSLSKLPMQERIHLYMSLSKVRLSSLVVATTACGYLVANQAPLSASVLQLIAVSSGVMLTAFAANTFNQIMESPFDSQMLRTQNRVLVRKRLTANHALTYGLTCGVTGSLVLLVSTHGHVTCSLAILNMLLYSCVYTPLKRFTIANTWVGAVVGGIPPLIGVTAALGASGSSSGLGIMAILSGILYTWQFPHFNSLSWNLRADYSKAGYRMMCVTDPKLCLRVTLRHSVYCTLLCSAAPYLSSFSSVPLVGLPHEWFAFESLLVNLPLVYLSYKFHRDPSSESSRTLFRYTLIHLPLILTLLFISKKNEESEREAVKIRKLAT